MGQAGRAALETAMSPSYEFAPGPFAPTVRSPRSLIAAALRAASRALDRLAWRLSSAATTPCAAARRESPMLEFHADAGAPEGALYVDGHLVGFVPGVTRL